MKIIEKEYNIETNEETITEREMTKEELKAYEEGLKIAEALKTEKEEKNKAKKAIADRLGLSEQDLATLFS